MQQTLERPAFDADVVTESGRIDFQKLARALDLTMPELAPILGAKPRSLNAHPTAKRPQEAAVKLVKMMNDLAAFLQERRYALYWLRTPQRDLSGSTPLAWLQEGHLDDVIKFVWALTSYEPD